MIHPASQSTWRTHPGLTLLSLTQALHPLRPPPQAANPSGTEPPSEPPLRPHLRAPVAPPRRPLPPQVAVTFAIVLGVIIYRISTAAALAMNSSPSVRSNIRVTVTATAVIINLVVIILLDEVYGCIARWLTKIGECPKPRAATAPGSPEPPAPCSGA